jgi:hypothetical protein
MNEIVKSESTPYEIMENVVAKGDLSKLTSQQRVIYYNDVCQSIGLNPLTRPLQFISFDGKIVLYAAKDATEQLRTLRGVSITRLEKEIVEGVFLVTAYASDKHGRTDVSTGAVTIKGLQGKALANAYKIAETQAKRRVTLSICGLGYLDEAEIPDVQGAKKIDVDFDTGEIHEAIVETKGWDKETIVSNGTPERIELIKAIAETESLDELKTLYGKAFTLHAGNLELMKDITELKDQRKNILMASKEWLAERDIAAQSQEDGA